MDYLFDTKRCRAYAEIDISGESVVPSNVTSLLELPPTSSICVGDIGEYTNAPSQVASWTYCTTEKETNDIAEQLDDLITVFDAKIDKINQIKCIASDCIIMVNIVVYNHQYLLPGLAFTPKQIFFLANIGAGLDLDIYHNQVHEDAD